MPYSDIFSQFYDLSELLEKWKSPIDRLSPAARGFVNSSPTVEAVALYAALTISRKSYPLPQKRRPTKAQIAAHSKAELLNREALDRAIVSETRGRGMTQEQELEVRDYIDNHNLTNQRAAMQHAEKRAKHVADLDDPKRHLEYLIEQGEARDKEERARRKAAAEERGKNPPAREEEEETWGESAFPRPTDPAEQEDSRSEAVTTAIAGPHEWDDPEADSSLVSHPPAERGAPKLETRKTPPKRKRSGEDPASERDPSQEEMDPEDPSVLDPGSWGDKPKQEEEPKQPPETPPEASQASSTKPDAAQQVSAEGSKGSKGKKEKKPAKPATPGGKKRYKWYTKKEKQWWTRAIPGDPTSARIPYDPKKHGDIEEVGGEEEEQVTHFLNSTHDTVDKMTKAMSKGNKEQKIQAFKKYAKVMTKQMLDAKHLVAGDKAIEGAKSKAKKKMMDALKFFGLHKGGRSGEIDPGIKKEFESLAAAAKKEREESGEPPLSPEEEAADTEKAEKFCKDVEKAVKENDVDRIHKLIRDGVTGLIAASAAAAIAMFAMSVPLLMILGIGALL